MIVTAVALLVLAAIFLVIGILSSSIAWLVISLVGTVAAGATLYASFVHYRAQAEGGSGPGGYPDAYGAGRQPAAMPAPATGVAPAAPSASLTLPDDWS